MKKRTLILMLTFILTFSVIFSLCGCVKQETNIDETQPTYETAEYTEATVDESTTAAPVVSGLINPLTGEAGYEEGYEGLKYIGIVVENTPAARPQWGLSTPDVVFEYEVEGGISRMLWLYSNISRVPSKVGPIRSARHDIVELALGYDLAFVHCGGSTYAYDLLNTHSELPDIDGNASYSCFVRDTSRNVASEHRLVLLGDKLQSVMNSLSVDMTIDPTKANPFNFVTAGTKRVLTGGACNSIGFSYSASYGYTFNYNQTTGLYDCNINGSPRVDDSGIQCAYTNVLVLYVDMVSMEDHSGHQDLLLEAGGSGYYLSGGNYEQIYWSKTSTTDMLKFRSADGTELQLNCGKSYIGFVRSTQASATTLR